MNVVIYHVFEILAPLKIPSVNNMYKPKSSFRKAYAWLYKDDKVQKYQDELINQGRANSDLPLIAEYKDSMSHMNIQYIFLLDKNFEKRDVSNMVKMTEDALMELTGIDDSKHRSISSLKALSYIPKKEYVLCKYEIVI